MLMEFEVNKILKEIVLLPKYSSFCLKKKLIFLIHFYHISSYLYYLCFLSSIRGIVYGLLPSVDLKQILSAMKPVHWKYPLVEIFITPEIMNICLILLVLCNITQQSNRPFFSLFILWRIGFAVLNVISVVNSM